MKRQVQQVGVRKWFGDDFLSIQNEQLAITEGFFGQFNKQFILTGCIVDGNDISPGIVGLIKDAKFYLCRFSGVQGVVWPVYFYAQKSNDTREYLDLQVKDIADNWNAEISNSDQGNYFQILQDNSSPRFLDMIQSDIKRFVTDEEKAYWNAKCPPNDPRLSNARTPVAHTHDPADINQDEDNRFATDTEKSFLERKSTNRQPCFYR